MGRISSPSPSIVPKVDHALRHIQSRQLCSNEKACRLSKLPFWMVHRHCLGKFRCDERTSHYFMGSRYNFGVPCRSMCLFTVCHYNTLQHSNRQGRNKDVIHSVLLW